MERRTGIFVAGATLALATVLGVFAGVGAASRTAVPRNVVAPSIRGTAQEGSVLTAQPGRWRHPKRLAFSYLWQRCAANGTGCVDIAKANDRIYAVQHADVGAAIRVLVTATGKHGSSSAASPTTAAVTALPPQAPTAALAPSISGTIAVGQVLTAQPGRWTGTAPIAFSYQWRRCDANGGDCSFTTDQSQTYRVAPADVGHALRVLVTARNAAAASAALSDASTAVPRPAGPARPRNTAAPTISGTPEQGQQLRGSRGGWANQPTRFGYAWLRCNRSGGACGVIGGAHGLTYSLAGADIGSTLRFRVEAANRAGVAAAFSAPTAVVAAAPAVKKASPPANTSRPVISGTAQEGKTLAGSRGTWTNSPTDFSYTWQRCDGSGHGCSSIAHAHRTSYTLTGDDIGHTIRFKVKASNSAGSSTAKSAPTASVRAAAKPANTSPPTISGPAQEGKSLSGDNGGWTEHPSSYSYAWLRCDANGGSCSAIGGARSTTYTLTAADVGTRLRLQVTAANSEGSTIATSVPTAVVQRAVAPPPPRPSGCPAPSGAADQVSAIAPPARLLVDTLQANPPVVTRSTFTLVVRFHVTSTCGRPVQGALVYATATPYNQFAIPPEAPTDASGWATLVFRRLQGFPVSSHQQLIAMFVRARKPGDPLLGGISTRRLVSVPVRLH